MAASSAFDCAPFLTLFTWYLPKKSVGSGRRKIREKRNEEWEQSGVGEVEKPRPNFLWRTLIKAFKICVPAFKVSRMFWEIETVIVYARSYDSTFVFTLPLLRSYCHHFPFFFRFWKKVIIVINASSPFFSSSSFPSSLHNRITVPFNSYSQQFTETSLILQNDSGNPPRWLFPSWQSLEGERLVARRFPWLADGLAQAKRLLQSGAFRRSSILQFLAIWCLLISFRVCWSIEKETRIGRRET